MSDRSPELPGSDYEYKLVIEWYNNYWTRFIAKYRDLSVSRWSIICLFRLRQKIDVLATDKSRYFAQLRLIIVNYGQLKILKLVISESWPFWEQKFTAILRIGLLDFYIYFNVICFGNVFIFEKPVHKQVNITLSAR